MNCQLYAMFVFLLTSGDFLFVRTDMRREMSNLENKISSIECYPSQKLDANHDYGFLTIFLFLRRFLQKTKTVKTEGC